MIVDSTIVIVGLVIAVCLFILGAVLHTSQKINKKGIPRTSEGITKALNNSAFVQDFGKKFIGSSSKELEVLIRKSKNPWGLTPFTFQAIRFGGGGILLFIGIVVAVFIDWTYALIFIAFGAMCFILPKSMYTSYANSRESQWNQLYQYMWVIKHNLSWHDPKKVFYEAERYIDTHSKTTPELVQGFHDFAAHWNGSYADEYIVENYFDFSIPKELYSIILNSQVVGEYPGKELDSLRRVILEKMNFHVQDTLSTVGMKATMYSSPFLLGSVGLVVLVPVIISLISAFS